MEKDIGGIRITIKEKTSKEEILIAFAKILTKFEDNYGVEEFSSINLYLQMHIDGERQAIVNKDNPTQRCTQYTFSGLQNHKTVIKNEDGSKTINFRKEVDLSRIERVILDEKNNKDNEYKCISIKQYENEKKEKAIRDEIYEKMMDEKRKQKQQEIELKQKVKEQNLYNFKNKIAEKLGCKIEDLHHHTTVINYFTNKQIISKYSNEAEVLKVRYRDPVTKVPAQTELYDINQNLIATYNE